MTNEQFDNTPFRKGMYVNVKGIENPQLLWAVDFENRKIGIDFCDELYFCKCTDCEIAHIVHITDTLNPERNGDYIYKIKTGDKLINLVPLHLDELNFKPPYKSHSEQPR